LAAAGIIGAMRSAFSAPVSSSSSGALDGPKVIDLSRVLGGPYCMQILGDHGAGLLK
jgi:crotonobetainyl-CoA:carnitine CoA-transferase CaiB-like acyl-CoA transferase